MSTMNVGTAWIEILPETSKLASSIRKDMKGVEAQATKSGQKMGGSLSKGIGKTFKRGIASAGIGAALVGGIAIKGGISRLLGIENAEAKLAGLGHNTKSVAKIMDNALKSVKGTAFGMDEAATTAAGAVAAGIKPGKELTKYLTLVGDAATIAGTGMGEMGSVLNKVTTAGKAQADNLNQLADRGIPIFSWLQEEYGVSAQELSKMVSKGKVDAATFNKVIQKNIGGAAQESGSTTTGAYKNMMASLSRIGANFLSQIGFGDLKTVFGSITTWLGPVEDVAGKAGIKVGELATQFRNKLEPAVAPVAAYVKDTLVPNLKTFSDWVANDGGPKVMELAGQIKSDLTPVFETLADIVENVLVPAAEKIIPAFKGAFDFFTEHKGAIYGVAGAYGALRLAVLLHAASQKVAMAGGMVQFMLNWAKATKIGTAATKASAAIQWIWNAAVNAGNKAALGTRIQLGLLKVQTLIMAGAQKVAAIATRLFNAALRANPIGLVITGLMALGAALVLAYKKSSTFRRIVDAAWAGIKKAFKVAWAYIKVAFSAMGRIIKGVWDGVIKPAFNGIRSGVGKVRSAFKTAVSKIGDIWSGLKSLVAKPVNFVIDTIYNKGIWEMVDLLPGGNPLKQAETVKFASGGVLPGYTPGRDVHQFVSPTGGRLALSGGEGIMRPEFVRAVGGKRGIDYLNALARGKNAGGFFNGGVLPLFGGTASRHTSGYSSAWAGDFNAPNDMGKPVRAWKDGIVAAMRYIGNRSYGRWVDVNHGNQSTRYAHLSRFGNIGLGDAVKAGQTLGYVGSVGNSSGPHLHFEINGGSVLGGSSDAKTSKQIKQENKKSNFLTAIPNLVKKFRSTWADVRGMGGGWASTLKNTLASKKGMMKWGVNAADNAIPNKLGFLPMPDNPLMDALKAAKIFDNGGILQPGAMAFNASNKPEAVFNHKQFARFAESKSGAVAVMPKRMTLVVEGQEFNAYVREAARDELDADDSYNNSRRRAYA